MTLFAVLLGGNLTVTPRLRGQIAGARIIAADSGMRHAASLGVTPELWIGDFDSAGSRLFAQYEKVPRQSHAAAKAATDGELAIAHARAQGAEQLVLVGGLGGQADHVLGHFGLALRLAGDGIVSFISSGDEEAHPVLSGDMALDLPPDTRLSIVPLTNLVGLSLFGVKWPLVEHDVPLGSTLTLSNVAEGRVLIGLEAGYAMAISYPA